MSREKERRTGRRQNQVERQEEVNMDRGKDRLRERRKKTKVNGQEKMEDGQRERQSDRKRKEDDPCRLDRRK